MFITVQQLAEKVNNKERFTIDELQHETKHERQEKAMYNSYHVIYEIFKTKDSKPFFRTYAFTCLGNKRNAMRIAGDILTDYILDMGYYSGSVHKINVIK